MSELFRRKVTAQAKLRIARQLTTEVANWPDYCGLTEDERSVLAEASRMIGEVCDYLLREDR